MWLPKQQPWRLPPLPLFYSSFRSLLLRASLLCAFSTATLCGLPPRPPPGEAPHFMVDYLVSACGLSMAEAMKAAKYLVHVKSTEKPDAVLRLMRQECLLGDAQIRRLIVIRPTVLVADPEKTLWPKIRCLREAGFSGPELARLVASSGVNIPIGNDLLGRIQFWRSLLGSNENLLKAVDRNSQLLSLRLEEKVFPTLSFLRSVGVSDEKIAYITMTSHCPVACTLERIRALVEQVKSFGFSPGSSMFVTALCVMGAINQSTLEAKMGFLRSFGLSQAEVVLAVRRFPRVITISQKKIQAVMDLLLEEAGCGPSYVAERPLLLGFSVERRLMPRFRAIQSLRVAGLAKGDCNLYNVMCLSDKKFMEKYIVPNKEEIPGLLEVYIASGRKSISR